MSKRNERRAAERAQRKDAYQQLRAQRSQSQQAIESVAQPLPEIPDAVAPSEPLVEAAETGTERPCVSAAQLAANRANAQHSTGATTPEGKAKSCMNALSHGLTGKNVLLPSDDEDEYNNLLNGFIRSLKPATEEELRLVQSMLDCHWRLDRARRLETGILYKGHLECAEKLKDRTPEEQARLIGVEAYLKYEKSLRNLQLQEARLLRRFEKDQAALALLQKTRRHEERLAELMAAQDQQNKSSSALPVNPNGFEFSTPHPPAATTRNQNPRARGKAA
jgi:hypothetical protein